MNIAHQPGSEPLTIPEQIPNPAVRPEAPPSPERRPVPKEPVQVPEKVPAHHYGTGSQPTCSVTATCMGNTRSRAD
jgi:hypothetical protein